MYRVEFKIDESNKLMGARAISLVEEPAIESDFIFFSKEKPQYIELKGDYKQVVAGLVLIPDRDIVRFNKAGEKYVGYFSKEQIQLIKDKFQKDGLINQVNTDHSQTNYIDAYLSESYIINNEHRLADAQAKGLTNACLGAWYVEYKIEDPETFQRVINGELNGFSLELFLQEVLEVKELSKNNNEVKFEKEMNGLIQRFKAVLAELEGIEEVSPTAPVVEKKLESAKTVDGKSTIKYGSKDEPVLVVAEDGTEQPAPDGKYELENGFVVTVSAGIASDIQPPQEKPQEQAKVDNSELESVKAELEKIKTDLAKVNEELKASKDEVVKLSKAPAAKPVTAAEVKTETVDLSKLSNLERERLKYGIK